MSADPNYGLLALVPAFVTIVISMTTRKVSLALFLGVVGGVSVYAFGGGDSNFFQALFRYLYDAFTTLERVKIVIFIMFIGGLLKIISASGAYRHFAEMLSKFLNSGRRSRVATWFLAMLMTFDDYSNILITGSSMKGISLKNGVSTAKLAYTINSVAGFSSVMLISTWVAFESSLMFDAAKSVGIDQSATSLFVSSLPYHFYTYLAVILTLVVCFTGKWFGYRFDTLEEAEESEPEEDNSNASYRHVLIPIGLFLILSFSGLFISGYLIIRNSEKIEMSLLNVMGSAPASEVLIFSSIVSVICAGFMVYRDKILRGKEIRVNFFEGVQEMVDVSIIILLAGALSAVSSDLGAGQYITENIKEFITPVLLPASIYVTALLITVATGFSWSSMVLVMPVAYHLGMAVTGVEVLPVVSAAVIAGAITGAQMIPYSDMTVITSATVGLTSFYHTKTQFLQVSAVAFSALLSYILFGMGFHWGVSLSAALLTLLTLHKLFAREDVEGSDEPEMLSVREATAEDSTR